MDARREATANVRKEKHNATALMKKTLSRLPRNKRAAARKDQTLAIKKAFARFKELFPHWKKIKTPAQLRKLTETVKTHRLKI